MDVVSSAVAALDAHRGIVGVASSGVRLLMSLVLAPENQVIP
jgi:hypothetical protein